jgi:N-acetylglucosamine-6-phosphate deacetylase
VTELRGLILTPDGFVQGRLQIDGERIAAIDGERLDETQARAAAGNKLPLILPGFIDLHVHGGGGRDLMEGGDAADAIARTHARHGTTAMLATTMTAPPAEIEAALDALGPRCKQRPKATARWLGVHLEGPFLSPDRLGAQPDFAVPGQLADVQALARRAPVRLITLAPERDGHLELIAALHEAGYKVQLGHSNASYEVGVAALAQGASGFTHLFNAMSPLHHREPGLVGAALAHAQHAELIPDLLHLHPGALRTALRAIPGCYCVTDATAAAGMPDGEYRLGRHPVFKCLGGVRLADGTLAGSALTLDQALRNLVEVLGLSLRDASARVSTVAADYLGVTERGRLAVGTYADLVVMDESLQLQQVFVEGEEIDDVVDA